MKRVTPFLLTKFYNSGMSTPLRVGVCIYCGSADKPLKTEHIIPYGWGLADTEGDVLLKASCGDCEDVTKAFEQYVLRDLFGNVRKVFGLRSRSGVLPKTVEQLVRDVDGNESTIGVPISEVADILFMPVLAEPGICRGAPAIIDCELNEMQLINVGVNTGKDTYINNNVDVVHVKMQFKDKTFEKFLLKVAYCTAVKNFGYDAVKNSTIPKIILGFDKRYGTYLGCMEHTYLPEARDNTWMQYGSYQVPNGIVSAVKLFAAVDGSPEYHVVIMTN